MPLYYIDCKTCSVVCDEVWRKQDTSVQLGQNSKRRANVVMVQQ